MNFNDLQFKPNPFIEGIQAIVQFPSGYSVSVIQGPYTYGGSQGLFELAVLFNGTMDYDNPVADGGVRGYLSPFEVISLIQQVEQFAPPNKPSRFLDLSVLQNSPLSPWRRRSWRRRYNT